MLSPPVVVGDVADEAETRGDRLRLFAPLSFEALPTPLSPLVVVGSVADVAAAMPLLLVVALPLLTAVTGAESDMMTTEQVGRGIARDHPAPADSTE